LWAQTYDRDLADIFAIQSEIAKAIADQLQAKLSAGEKAEIEQKPTNDLVAYDLYVRGKALGELGTPTFSARVRSNQLEAAGLLEQAVARDQKFFLAYCQLAEVNDRLYFFGSDHTPARLALSEQAVAAAVRLRPDSGEAHLALGRHAYLAYRDYNRARSELALAARALPNDAWTIAYVGFIDRRQARWEEHIANLNRALELDPRNLYLLQEFSVSYLVLRRYPEMTAILDHALTLAPEDPTLRVGRAAVEFYSRGDTQPLHRAIDAILAQNPSAGSAVAIQWLTLAMCERDWAGVAKAVSNIPPDGISTENTWFPKSWFEAIAARARGNSASAQAAFSTARAEVEKIVRDQPDYGEPLCVLGMVDAGLGRKEDAIREGLRAVQLLPETKDALNAVNARRFLGVIYTWLGEKDRAIEELGAAITRPGYLNYGRLKLHPEWDALRGDPRFEKIVSSLAQKETK
jgi:Predicted integral membrane protein